MAADLHRTIDTLWRMEAPKVLAVLTRMLRDLDQAEELAQDALVAALEHWPREGLPDNPAAWWMATAKRRAIDRLRQRQLHQRKHADIAFELEGQVMAGPDSTVQLDDAIGDDLLRLMFIACHPVLPADSRVALTLRLLGGLSTAEIARAFLQPEATVAQRIVRAKRTLAQKQVPYEVPRAEAMPERLASVLEAIYLVFNEGYAASAGDDWMRPALCEEALRLARIMAHRLPVPPVLGLLALMELQASRAAARTDAQGTPVLLDQQNRARWDWLQIERGQQALARALAAGGGRDPYVLQARIAACHAAARRAEDTDWARIAALYAQLLQVMPSPVVALNRVVAVSRSDGAFAAWALLQPLLADARLQGYAPLQVVRGDLLQQLGRADDARAAFAAAAALTGNARERELLLLRAQRSGSALSSDRNGI